MPSLASFGPALAGGMLIGLGAVVLMAWLGRIAGISGIVAALPEPGSGWRWSFLAGLVAGPLLVGGLTGTSPLAAPAVAWPLLIVAGLLVGFGTGLGRGCTSGHGICGLARFSPRSLVATATFMAAAMATVLVIRHVL